MASATEQADEAPSFQRVETLRSEARLTRKRTLGNLFGATDIAAEVEAELLEPAVASPRVIIKTGATNSGSLSPTGTHSPLEHSLHQNKTKVMQSLFRLESLPKLHLWSIVFFFYSSVIFAFFERIWSEEILVTRNVCDLASVSSDFRKWSSHICQTNYTSGESVPVTGLYTDHLPCKSRCMKWDGKLTGFDTLDTMVFTAFIVEAAANVTTTRGLELFAWYTDMENKTGGPLVFADLPKSNTSSDTATLTCKKGQQCDVILSEEPVFAVKREFNLQVVLMNADELDDLGLDHIGVGFVHNDRKVTILDLCCRYFFITCAAALIIDYLRHLGVPWKRWNKGWLGHDKHKGGKWTTEHRWSFFLCICLIFYCNPTKVLQLLLETEHGRNTDYWGHRILLFFDHNVAMYVTQIVRMFEIVFLACCLDKRPVWTLRMSEWRRGWLYWVLVAWFVVLVGTDAARLWSGYDTYYSREHGDNNYFDGAMPSYTVIITNFLIVVWVIGMIVFFLYSSAALSRQVYWVSRARQLAFRFFFFLYVWHMGFTITELVFCFYKKTTGRHVYETLICTDVSTLQTADLIANGVFVLTLCYIFGPPADRWELPPDPFLERKRWTNSVWPHEWVKTLNRAAGSTVYFFIWYSERFNFLLTNKMLVKKKRRGFRQGVLGAALAVAEEVVRSQESKKPKRLFCLEMAIDMLCLSWEVYGEEPGTDHSRELNKEDPYMPIDCPRHGFELLDIVNGSVESKEAQSLKVEDRSHRHPLIYRYVPAVRCRYRGGCTHGHGGRSAGMAYVCEESDCKGFAICAACLKNNQMPDRYCSSVQETADPSHPLTPRSIRPMSTSRSFGKLKDGNDDKVRLKSKEEQFKSADLQAIICRDEDRVVVAIRGTSNLANVKTDAQFFREVFSLMDDRDRKPTYYFAGLRGALRKLRHRLGFGIPRVHKGFLRAFESVGPELLARLRVVIEAHPRHELVVTGHSLGGAVAILFACSVRHALGISPTVYTYGSPRVGNVTFRERYNWMVPDTFRIVNENDIISTLPWAVFGYYVHCGKEVAIDKKGTLIIEPSFMERFLTPTKVKPHTGGLSLQCRQSANVADHQMNRYAISLSAVGKLLGVGDCVLEMKPPGKALWMIARQRFREDGGCSACGMPGESLPCCPVSGGVHRVWLRRDHGAEDVHTFFEAREVAFKGRDGREHRFTVTNGHLDLELEGAAVDHFNVEELYLDPLARTLKLSGGLVVALPDADAVAVCEALKMMLRQTQVTHDLDEKLAALAGGSTLERGETVREALLKAMRQSSITVEARPNLLIAGGWTHNTPNLPISPLLESQNVQSVCSESDTRASAVDTSSACQHLDATVRVDLTTPLERPLTFDRQLSGVLPLPGVLRQPSEQPKAVGGRESDTGSWCGLAQWKDKAADLSTPLLRPGRGRGVAVAGGSRNRGTISLSATPPAAVAATFHTGTSDPVSTLRTPPERETLEPLPRPGRGVGHPPPNGWRPP
eukprot:Hpha_TRINITY_DN33751_c0_g1::TRINITY_DN33751_c0_g1_i1::g.25157::m.25157